MHPLSWACCIQNDPPSPGPVKLVELGAEKRAKDACGTRPLLYRACVRCGVFVLPDCVGHRSTDLWQALQQQAATGHHQHRRRRVVAVLWNDKIWRLHITLHFKCHAILQNKLQLLGRISGQVLEPLVQAAHLHVGRGRGCEATDTQLPYDPRDTGHRSSPREGAGGGGGLGGGRKQGTGV